MSDTPRRVAGRSWWRRNRWWLAALLPALALAIAASSYRLLNWYLPGPWMKQAAIGGPTVTFDQTWQRRDETFRRVVTVTQTAAKVVPDDGETRAPKGAKLFKIDLHFEAAPDQILFGCQMRLRDAHGRSFSPTDGKVSLGNTVTDIITTTSCVPDDAKGPHFLGFDNEIRQSDTPRPPAWDEWVSFALPADAEPAALEIMWDTPDYLTIRLP